MAITKIWAVKDDLRRVLNYIENPDKTKEELGEAAPDYIIQKPEELLEIIA